MWLINESGMRWIWLENNCNWFQILLIVTVKILYNIIYFKVLEYYRTVVACKMKYFKFLKIYNISTQKTNKEKRLQTRHIPKCRTEKSVHSMLPILLLAYFSLSYFEFPQSAYHIAQLCQWQHMAQSQTRQISFFYVYVFYQTMILTITIHQNRPPPVCNLKEA